MPARLSAVQARVLFVLVPALLVLIAIAGTADYVLIGRLREPLIEAQREQVARARQVLIRRMGAPVQDLRFLATFPALRSLLEGDESQKATALSLFSHFLAVNRRYDELRWIDERGRERIRVERRGDGLRIVPEGELQDASARQYFQSTMRLAANQLYFSRFELDADRGQLELPHKPILRAATPVFSVGGKPRGIVVLNFLGANVLTAMQETAALSQLQLELLDDEGYWLMARNPDDAWGFMLGHPERTLAARQPLLWRALLRTDSGMVNDEAGQWIHDRFQIDPVGMETNEESQASWSWFILSHVPQAELDARENPVHLTILIVTAALFAGMAWVTIRLAVARHHRALVTAALEARTEELTVANGALQNSLDTQRKMQKELVRAEKLSSLGLMVAGVAHELNTPLGSAAVTVSGVEKATGEFSQQVQRGLRLSELEAFLGQLGEGLPLLKHSIDRASGLVQRFKQLAVDRQTEERRFFNLHEVVEDSLHLVIKRQAGKRQTLSIEIPPGLMLDSYPGPLGQVIDNLVGNAFLHAFPDDRAGVVRVIAEEEDEGRVVSLSVADDGCGVTPAIRSRVFELFFTTRRNAGGTGLGLYMAHQLTCEVLGGSLQLEESDAPGCRFVLRVPRFAD